MPHARSQCIKWLINQCLYYCMPAWSVATVATVLPLLPYAILLLIVRIYSICHIFRHLLFSFLFTYFSFFQTSDFFPYFLSIPVPYSLTRAVINKETTFWCFSSSRYSFLIDRYQICSNADRRACHLLKELPYCAIVRTSPDSVI